jgi:hypothetical protein
MLGVIEENVKTANWGGHYSIFTSAVVGAAPANSLRAKIVALGNSADPVELELAATAILLATDGYVDPWKETEQRKPEKAAGGRIDRAKVLLSQFKSLDEQRLIPQNT